MTRDEIGKITGESLDFMVTGHGYWFDKESGHQIDDRLRIALTDARFELYRVNRELALISLTLSTLRDIRAK